MGRSLVSLVCVLCWLTIANAQSIDCEKAQTFADKTICNNQSFSQMNMQLSEVFKLAKNKAGNSDVFQTITNGNLALRDQCKDQDCVRNWLENSITLYQYLLKIIPADNFGEYPKEVQKLCKNQKTSIDILACGEARLNYQQKVLISQIQNLMGTAKSEKQKELVRSFYTQWKMDRLKYCTLEFSGDPMHSLSISGCLLRWTKDLCHKTEDSKSFLKGLADSKITNESVVNSSVMEMQ
ncbi:MAG: hypothetical protein LUC43_06280 [Burkholderiales bacterium]|nr:hypothetical protein [Burkholderiales bacterium]